MVRAYIPYMKKEPELVKVKGTKFYATINDSGSFAGFMDRDIQVPTKGGMKVDCGSRVVELTITRVFVRENPLVEVENEI